MKLVSGVWLADTPWKQLPETEVYNVLRLDSFVYIIKILNFSADVLLYHAQSFILRSFLLQVEVFTVFQVPTPDWLAVCLE